MKQAHPRSFEVRLKGDPEPFLARLRAAGGDAEAARRRAAGAAAGGADAGPAVADRRRPRASRFATCGRTAVRSKTCSSKRSGE